MEPHVKIIGNGYICRELGISGIDGNYDRVHANLLEINYDKSGLSCKIEYYLNNNNNSVVNSISNMLNIIAAYSKG